MTPKYVYFLAYAGEKEEKPDELWICFTRRFIKR